MRRCIAIAFAFLLTAWLALYGSKSAQQIKGRAPITVVVTDPTGAAIPHAEVQIASAPSLGLPAPELETNGAGTLAVELQPGEYDITAHALGFRTAGRHIIAQSGVAQSVQVALQVGGCPPGCVVALQSAVEQLFTVKGVVVDPSGAVIPQAEVVFKGESDRIAANTGMDGSVNLNLEAGKYVVTISAVGFATTKLVDFFVPAPTADVFRVSLKIDQSQTFYGSDLGHSGIAHVPTIPSELPNIIQDEPTRPSSPVAQPATTKHRSMRCLYLWRCSASQP